LLASVGSGLGDGDDFGQVRRLAYELGEHAASRAEAQNGNAQRRRRRRRRS